MNSTTQLHALRTIFMSDVHLGSRECRVSLVLDFLRHTESEILYLVGDIIDFESLRRNFYWPATHTEVLSLLVAKSFAGTRVVYLPGNHDADLRAFAGAELRHFEIALEAIHTTRAGDRLLVLHGDQFDTLVRDDTYAVHLGAFACRRLLELNRLGHWMQEQAGRPYWSIAQFVKSRFRCAHRYVERFRDATLEAARRAGVDGVVCGHIHQAELTQRDSLLYCNDGDWVESCTALVEDHLGQLSLLRWPQRDRSYVVERIEAQSMGIVAR